MDGAYLSESSVRRIIAKEKTGYQKIKETIEQILPAWGIENRQIVQIYSSAWEINGFYVIKRYEDREKKGLHSPSWRKCVTSNNQSSPEWNRLFTLLKLTAC